MIMRPNIIVHIIALTEVESKSGCCEPTKDTPYLALAGKLWGVFCEDFGENWPCYNDTALYLVSVVWDAEPWNIWQDM